MMKIELEDQLQTSFHDAKNIDKIRQLIIEDTNIWTKKLFCRR
jgi:hypothetical protein